MKPLLVLALFLLLVGLLLSLFGCSGEEYHCTSTCVEKGWAQTARECSDDPFVRTKACSEQASRSPELGEAVKVVSTGEERTTLVVSLLDDGRGFAVGGPQAEAELGSGVYALSDHALLGIVESVDGDLSICSEVDSDE